MIFTRCGRINQIDLNPDTVDILHLSEYILDPRLVVVDSEGTAGTTADIQIEDVGQESYLEDFDGGGSGIFQAGVGDFEGAA